MASSRVNHPKHYNTGSIEIIDAIEDWALGFHLGNVVKYVARAAHKGSELEDLQKARWYLDRKIKKLEKLKKAPKKKPKRRRKAVHDKVHRPRRKRGISG